MQSRSVSFRIAYLLGIDDEKLLEMFNDEFSQSNQLKYFSNYVDAETLRVLCRLRSYLIMRCNIENNSSNLLESLLNAYPKECSYLKEKNIDLNLFLNSSLLKIINNFSKMINIISYKVLVDLDVPFVDDLLSFFHLEKLDYDTLLEIQKKSKLKDNFFGVYFPYMHKIEAVIKYIFRTDFNTISAAYSIINKRIPKISEYSYIYREEMGVDLDESAVINLVTILSEYKDKNPTLEIKKIIKLTEQQKIKENIERIKKIKVEKKLLNILKLKRTSIFIDCNSVEFFKILCFLRSLENIDTIESIVLFVDEKSNIFWKEFDKFYLGDLNIIIISLNNQITNDKLYTNNRVIKEVCKKVYLDAVHQILVCSNTLSFSGLFDSIETVKFIYCYTNINLKENYKNYLRENHVLSCSLNDMETQEFFDVYLNLSIMFSFLYYVSKKTICNLDKKNLLSNIINLLKNETSMKVEEKEISKCMNTCYNDLNISVDNDKVELSLVDIKIEV